MILLQIFLTALVIVSALGALCFIPNQESRLIKGGIAIFIVISLSAIYTISRYYLIPYNADETRRAVLLAGDEPDYLFGALSIAKDGNIDVANNIKNQDYLLFQNRPGWGWDFSYFNRISNNRIEHREHEWGDSRYSQHRPGMMAFLSPVFFLANGDYRWWSYTLISSFVAACALLILFLGLKNQISANVTAAFCLIPFLSPPILFYANQAYPEVICGSLIAVAFLLSVQGGKSLYVSAFIFCLVIWFSDRIFVPSFILAFYILFQSRGKLQISLVFSVMALGYVFFALYCLHRFGVPYPLTHDETFGFNYGSIFSRFFQISFDRVQGWVWLFPPALLIPFLALEILRNKKTRLSGIIVLLMLLTYLSLIAVFNDWRGGTNPRGRFYVIAQFIFLCMVFLALAGEMYKKRKLFISILIVLGSLSLMQLPWLIQNPHWWFRAYHPFFGLEAIQKYFVYLPNLPDNAQREEWINLFYWLPFLLMPSTICFFYYLRKDRHIS